MFKCIYTKDIFIPLEDKGLDPILTISGDFRFKHFIYFSLICGHPENINTNLILRHYPILSTHKSLNDFIHLAKELAYHVNTFKDKLYTNLSVLESNANRPILKLNRLKTHYNKLNHVLENQKITQHEYDVALNALINNFIFNTLRKQETALCLLELSPKLKDEIKSYLRGLE